MEIAVLCGQCAPRLPRCAHIGLYPGVEPPSNGRSVAFFRSRHRFHGPLSAFQRHAHTPFR